MWTFMYGKWGLKSVFFFFFFIAYNILDFQWQKNDKFSTPVPILSSLYRNKVFDKIQNSHSVGGNSIFSSSWYLYRSRSLPWKVWTTLCFVFITYQAARYCIFTHMYKLNSSVIVKCSCSIVKMPTNEREQDTYKAAVKSFIEMNELNAQFKTVKVSQHLLKISQLLKI